MNIKEVLVQVVQVARAKFSPYNLLLPHLDNLPLNRPIYIFALGKAAYQMTEATLNIASRDPFIRIVGGLVITRYGNAKGLLKGMQILESSHPIPNEDSLKAGDAAVDFLRKLKEDDILIVLLSGGGSALMEKPIPGVTLDDIIEQTREMLENGSDIEYINTERKKFSSIKGGKLLNHIKCRSVMIYAMSDVPGDKAKYIASNPFLPQAETEASEMGLNSFHRFDKLSGGRFQTTDKAIVYKIIGNNKTFRDSVREAALEHFSTLQSDNIHIISTELTGEAIQSGREIAKMAELITRQKGKGFTAFRTPCLLIFGGENSVTVRGNGIGGRCTELALATVEIMSHLPNCVLMTYATDGQDGFCNASGAIVDASTKDKILEHGIDIESFLYDNDSYTALKAAGAIIPSESTGINVNDIVLLYVH
jgi:glycerate 2-kinase